MEVAASLALPASVSRGIEALPDEILIKIAKHLEPHESSKRANLRNLSLVSRKLLLSCNAACTSLSVSGLKASRIPRLLRRFPDLTSLNLSFLFDCSEETLTAVGRCCSRLRELHVPDTCKVSSDAAVAGKGLLAICRGCPNLETLSLPSYKGPAAALVALGKAECLRVLHLKGALNLDDAAVSHVAGRCRFLEELDLSFSGISDSALRALASGLLHLRKLDLRHCKNITGAGVASLAEGCRKLQMLHLGVLQLDDAGLLALGKHSTDLEELCLDYGSGAHGPFSQSAVAALAQGCRKLRVLSLRGSKQVDDHSLRGLAKGCPSLEELDLHACTEVGDLGLHSVVLGCKKLKSVVLTGTSVGPAGLAAFEGGLPLLSTLRLNGELITDAVLKSVACACPSLAELHLNGCRVSDEGLEALLRNCKRLHTLVLKSCADVKATAFASTSLLHLTTVHLPFCGITDTGLLALAAAAPSLTCLILSCCYKLTADGCAEALRAMACLSSVIVTGCPQLSRADVLLLTKAARVSLKQLRVSRPGSLDDEYTLKRISAGWSLPSWARGSLGMSSSAKF